MNNLKMDLDNNDWINKISDEFTRICEDSGLNKKQINEFLNATETISSTFSNLGYPEIANHINNTIDFCISNIVCQELINHK